MEMVFILLHYLIFEVTKIFTFLKKKIYFVRKSNPDPYNDNGNPTWTIYDQGTSVKLEKALINKATHI